MKDISISLLTVCGLEELEHHGSRGVTHVLSILDPDHPDPEAFGLYAQHQRSILRFHDAIEPSPRVVLPAREHVEAILAFGQSLGGAGDMEPHLLVHCHAGISRSTAAMAMILAQLAPEQSEGAIFEHLVSIRPKAWPNSRMIGFADELLGRGSKLAAELGPLYRRQLAAYPHIRDFMVANARGYEVALADAA